MILQIIIGKLYYPLLIMTNINIYADLSIMTSVKLLLFLGYIWSLYLAIYVFQYPTYKA